MHRAIISGVGSYLPEKRLTNFDLERMVETSDEWIRSRTGIAERRIADASEATSDMAYYAAKAALTDADLEPSDIDLIIVATETPDHIFPPVACQVQQRLGCRNVGAYDLHMTCVGFVAALEAARAYIQGGIYRHILVVGADTLSRFTDYTDRGTCILFADGAGAFVVSCSDHPKRRGIISTTVHASGEHFDSLYVPAGGSRCPTETEDAKAKIVMEGRKIFKLAVTVMADTAQNMLETTGYTKDDIRWLIPHQANQRIMEAVAERIDFPMDRVISTIERVGNNSSATIPIAINTAIRDGRVKRGDLLMLVTFGAGLVWGGALLEY